VVGLGFNALDETDWERRFFFLLVTSGKRRLWFFCYSVQVEYSATRCVYQCGMTYKVNSTGLWSYSTQVWTSEFVSLELYERGSGRGGSV
jgi:hypothetical protein